MYNSRNPKHAAQREKPETARSGTKWTDEEDKQLMDNAFSKMPLEEIALKHKRTVVSIKLRIMQNVLNISQSGNDPSQTLEVLSDRVNIPLSEINEFKTNQTTKKTYTAKTKETTETQSSSHPPSSQVPQITTEQFTEFMGVVTEIRDLLRVLVSNTTPK